MAGILPFLLICVALLVVHPPSASGFPTVSSLGIKTRRVEIEGGQKNNPTAIVPKLNPGVRRRNSVGLELNPLLVSTGRLLWQNRKQARSLLGDLCNLGSYVNNPSRPQDVTSFAFIPICAFLLAPFYPIAGGTVV